MEFLVIVIALVIVYFNGPVHFLQGDQWYLNGFAKLNISTIKTKFVIGLVVPVMVAALAVTLLDNYSKFLVLLLNLAVLLFSFGRGDIENKIDELIKDFYHDDVQAAFHDLEELNHDDQEQVKVSNNSEFQNLLLQSVSYRLFEYVFPTLFWFSLLGAPGAVLYRCVVLLAENNNQNEQEVELSDYLLWVIEWLPVRLLGLCFALVGNFGSCIKSWQEGFFCSKRTSSQAISYYVEAAINIDLTKIETDQNAKEVEMINKLFQRALIVVVCVIAVLEVM
jgi:AmpE protein